MVERHLERPCAYVETDRGVQDMHVGGSRRPVGQQQRDDSHAHQQKATGGLSVNELIERREDLVETLFPRGVIDAFLRLWSGSLVIAHVVHLLTVGRLLKNALLAFFSALRHKARFVACFIFENLQSLKMAAQPRAARRLPKNGLLPQPVNREKADRRLILHPWPG